MTYSDVWKVDPIHPMNEFPRPQEAEVMFNYNKLNLKEIRKSRAGSAPGRSGIYYML